MAPTSIFLTYLLSQLVAFHSGHAFHPINEVTLRQAELVL